MNNGEHWFPVYVGLGSNLQSPAKQIENAFGDLEEIHKTQLYAKSALYRSAPFGGVEQPDFVNAAAVLLTQLSPQELLTELQRIEAARGRERDDTRWGPRVLDLDLLAYSDREIDEPGLKVPHPGIGERNFVLLPLRDIAPDLNIAGIGSINSIAINSEPAISRIG